ncbi:right-handed parallel beta-helix repeat-containing protein [Citricoccus sp. SGAir0253]|uniref:right-handed parallel beta-helix repeat-containing protein n=1 Tax=Citricoccus sp. SGAir0253 TaxID=2567881 RepID=UPI00143D277C|nr:right-handed parallel beta-helix repeat-containing protein [Citricoccus sp. SGAir0253]
MPADSERQHLLRRRSMLKSAAIPLGAGLIGGGVGFSMSELGRPEEADPRVAPEGLKRFSTSGTDRPERFQDFLDSLADGDSAVVDGSFSIRSATIRANSVRIGFGPGAKLVLEEPFEDGVVIEGDRVSLFGGSIEGPGAWNGVNTPWTHAMVHVKGESFTAQGMTLLKVPKVGFGIRGNGGGIRDCVIVGGYPERSWTGVETGHFGIVFDPSTGSSRSTAGSVHGTSIASCVQGISIANHGPGVGGSYSMVQNSFEDCHNHGVYAQSGLGNVVANNSFIGCQVPIVASGEGHVISNNSLRAKMDGTTRDLTGINVRDARNCVVANNVIKGQVSSSSVAVSLDSINETAIVGNIIHGNVISVQGEGRPVIRVGQNSTECSFNKVEGNVISGGGQAGQAVVVVTVASESTGGRFNEVTSNTIRTVTSTAGILLERQVSGTVRHNTVIADSQRPMPEQKAVIVRDSSRVLVKDNVWRTSGDGDMTEPFVEVNSAGNFLAGNMKEGPRGLEEIARSPRT